MACWSAMPECADRGGEKVVYLISYDLIGERKDYDAVEQVVRAASKGRYVRCLRSTWLIRSDIEAPAEMKELLESFTDSDDQFLVVEIVNELHGRLPQDVLAGIRTIQAR